MTPAEKAHALRNAIPTGGLFTDKTWRLATKPYPLEARIYDQIIELGARLHLFNKAGNLLYRQSVEGKQPAWIHRYLDAGKPPELLETARHRHFKNDLPRVIRPDLLLTDDGFCMTELDSVPGGIGLTAWLQERQGGKDEGGGMKDEKENQTTEGGRRKAEHETTMRNGFFSVLQSEIRNPSSSFILHPSSFPQIAIVISEEARDYRPEMEWMVEESSKFGVRGSTLAVCGPEELEYRAEGVFLRGNRIDVVYRFFELFDLPNIAHVEQLIAAAANGLVRVTPPFKPQLEEKLWFALFWFPQLTDFWRRELGDRYDRDLRKIIPFTWLLDPAPLPPHAVIPRLDIHDWNQLVRFSQKQRELILKVSGFSADAWGSRGVFLGSDMPGDEWKKVVLAALAEFDRQPRILQSFARSRLVEHAWYDFEHEQFLPMKGRARLCPYYFVEGDKPRLGGILATICPPDKKFIHGMEDAILTLAVRA